MSGGVSLSTSFLPPSPSLGFGSRRANLPRLGLSLPKLPSLIKGLSAESLGSGLRTPPVEDMSTTFEPSLASHDSYAMHGYPTSMTHAGRNGAGFDDVRNSQYYRYSTQHQQPQQQLHSQVASHSQPRNGTFSSATQAASTSRYTTQPSTPSADSVVSSTKEGPLSRRGSETLIYHSLQIPKCISPAGGNLADFAAQMTCLFWFQSTEDLKKAESILTRPSNAPIPRLATYAKPYDQFRKWVYSVLSTTQVTQNVVLLALLFIYRLKMLTPQIKGRAGSEYRLLTVALMLGNKFLDDNTYTNKTWAEVSCFAVQEIHVMEVEFLSNMRYNLTATATQWEHWLNKLACFREYYERALRAPASPVLVPSPNAKGYNSPIPSPTGKISSGVPSLPVTPTHTQNWSAYQANAVSPLATKPNVSFPIARKRGPEEEASIEHPAKRPAPIRAPLNIPVVNVRPSTSVIDTSRAPPRLTLVTEQPQHLSTTYTPTSAFSQTSQQMVAGPQGAISLPPLQPGIRAMSTVYQPTPVSLVQQPTLAAPTSAAMPPVNYSSHASMHFGTPSKHHGAANLAQYNSSPLLDHLGSQGPGVHTPIAHTPISNSPSVYLQQRPSPYKPVRHVNTLLCPPPSASLEQYHLSVPVPPTQMHYQPLGRPNDLRTGIVPEFLVYGRGGQHHGLNPQGAPQGNYPS